MNYDSVYDLINKVWLDTEDIQNLCSCSRNSAMTIRREIEEKVKKLGKRLPDSRRKVVPTLLVLDYLGIDVDSVLHLISKKELLWVLEILIYQLKMVANGYLN